RARGKLDGPFAGVPFALKDLLPYPGMRAAFGARLFAANVAAAGSPFTERLDAAGLVVVGKTATSELGLLGSTETLLEGVTHNPWDLSRSAAGSSGGAAAAVAAGLVPFAHASDGGGSIRIPASVCGLFGFKPGRGSVASTGGPPSPFADLVSELCVSRTVRDAAGLFAAVEADGGTKRVGRVTGPARERLRVGTWSRTLMGREPAAEPARALERAAALLAELGHDVAPATPPAIDGAALSDAFFTLAGASIAPIFDMMAGMLGRAVGASDFEPFTRAVVDAFRARPPSCVEASTRAFAAATAELEATLARFDVVLTPTLAIEPWPLGHLSPTLTREELIARTEEAVGYTPIHNVAGCPSMSVPLHWSAAGLPVGVCFAAPRGAEARLFALAFELEQAAPWADRWAPLSYPRLVEA
ncbi:MAG: amidase, partial [Myxococcales bacterium]|nr:amidase [Myxococcales bacterium]